MYQKINFSSFDRAFINAERTDNFSLQGRRVLFDYLESLEEGTGEEIELDVVALCCEYQEYDYHSIALNYSIALDSNGLVIDYEDELKSIVGAFLQERTIVVGEVDGGFVYASF
jgi:hypothetical protein